MALTAEQEAREREAQERADYFASLPRRPFRDHCDHIEQVPSTFQPCNGPRVAVCIDCGRVV